MAGSGFDAERAEIERSYAALGTQFRLFGAEELGRRYVVVRLARYAVNAHVDYSDLQRILGGLREFHGWHAAWKKAALESEELARQEEASGHPISIHGALDDLVTTGEAALMARTAPRGELCVFGDGFHTCTNVNDRLVPLMTGWVLDRLRQER